MASEHDHRSGNRSLPEKRLTLYHIPSIPSCVQRLSARTTGPGTSQPSWTVRGNPHRRPISPRAIPPRPRSGGRAGSCPAPRDAAIMRPSTASACSSTDRAAVFGTEAAKPQPPPAARVTANTPQPRSARGSAHLRTHAHTCDDGDPDLALVIAAWPMLPAADKAKAVAAVRSTYNGPDAPQGPKP